LSSEKGYVTLKDIAKRAGVSLNTVSRALKNSYDISDKTKKRIKTLALEMGYYPDTTAVSLKSKKTSIVGLVLPDNTDYFYSLLLEEIQAFSQQYGYQIILSNSRRDSKNEKSCIKLLLERRVDGLLIWPSFFSDSFVDYLEKSKIPFVIIGKDFPDKDITEVYDDQEKGSYNAVNLLLSSGCGNVFFVKHKDEKEDLKVNGIKRAFEDNKIAFGKNNIIEIDSIKRKEGVKNKVIYTIIKEAALKNPIGFYTTNDEMAIELMAITRENGKRIPEEIAVVGYTDVFFSEIVSPNLTTVSVDVSKMASKAFLNLMKKMHHPGCTPKKVVIPVKLVKRGTTKV